jgi:hypothetical protein
VQLGLDGNVATGVVHTREKSLTSHHNTAVALIYLIHLSRSDTCKIVLQSSITIGALGGGRLGDGGNSAGAHGLPAVAGAQGD